jgi:photosystem II stability/assembly factor-like uncharacterized protein
LKKSLLLLKFKEMMKTTFCFILGLLFNLSVDAQWVKVHEDTIVDAITEIKAFDPDFIIAGGMHYGAGTPDGRLWISTDDGLSWLIDTVDVAIWAISIPVTNVIYAGGRDGWYMKSINGGVNWVSSNLNSGFASDIWDLMFINDTLGLAYSSVFGVRRTSDGGSNWYDVEVDSIFPIVYFEDDYTMEKFCATETAIYFASPYGIYRSGDNGVSWNRLLYSDSNSFRSIYMFDDLEGFAGDYKGNLFHTSDEWITHEVLHIGDQGIHGIDFVTDSIGFLAYGGLNYYGPDDTCGRVFYTHDRGNHWFSDKVSDWRVSSISCADSSCFAVGVYGEIFRCENLISYVYGLEEQYQEQIQVFPNPVENVLYISSASQGNIDVRMYDLNGQLIFSGSGTGSVQCDCSGLSSGMYFLDAACDGFRSVSKIIHR